MATLLFYSDQVVGRSDGVDHELTALLRGTRGRIGYIPSASDLKRRYFAKAQVHYDEIGLGQLWYFDLGEEYAAAAVSELLTCEAIHLSGGDTSHFLMLMQKRNFKGVLRRYVAEGGILIGVSAGAMLMGQSISLCRAFGESSVSLKDEKALGLVDFDFYPHFDGDEKTRKKLLAHSMRAKWPLLACHDTEGIIVAGGEVRYVGEPLRVEKGRATNVGHP